MNNNLIKNSVSLRKKQTGFTLIEVMVVVVIIGILGALIVPNILGRADDAKITAAQSDIRSISNALNLYKLDNHTYPSTDQGLAALINKPSGYPEARNWNQDGYLKKEPKDPWGNEYQYISPGSQGKYDLFSYGADGKESGEGTDKDIANWEL